MAIPKVIVSQNGGRVFDVSNITKYALFGKGINMSSLALHNYQEHMEEHVDAAWDEDNEAFSEAVKKFKDSFYLRDNLQVTHISPVLAKPSKRDALADFTSAFIDTHIDQLSTVGPMRIFTFSDKETEFLYGLFNITKEQLLEMIMNMFEHAYEGSVQFHRDKQIVREAPHKVLITAILVESLQQGYDDMVEVCEYLMGFSEYPLVFRRFWKFVDESVMNHTMEHLKNKFKTKAKGLNNLLALLRYDMNSSINAWREELKTGMDGYYVELINRVRGQMSSTFKNIAREYYKNHEDNKTQFTKGGKHDDGHLADHEGHAHILSSTVENTYNKFLTSPIYSPFIEALAEANKVDKNNLEGYLNQIFTTKNNKLYRFLEATLTAYFQHNHTATKIDGEFVNFGLGLYKSIGTSKNPLYQEIRQILDFWVFDIINITQFTKNDGTIINYKRSLFNYMIFMINRHN